MSWENDVLKEAATMQKRSGRDIRKKALLLFLTTCTMALAVILGTALAQTGGDVKAPQIPPIKKTGLFPTVALSAEPQSLSDAISKAAPIAIPAASASSFLHCDAGQTVHVYKYVSSVTHGTVVVMYCK